MFDEIYQGGKAKHKHAILTQNPVPAGKYYMLKCECDDHTVHFGGYKSALQGAAKHLDIPFHQLPRSYQAALDHLGYEVLGCDPAKQAANNEVFEKALREGYIPHNTRTTRKSFGNYGTPQTKAAPPAVEPQRASTSTPSSTTRITRPRGGEFYYAWWKDDKKFYLCMIIPWDNNRDFGLTEIRKGVHGLGLFDTKLTKVPRCYNIDCDSDPPKIVGWAEGYEDGGSLENSRVFPTLFFHPPKNLAAWTRATYLRPFDWRRPNFDDPQYKLNPKWVDVALEAMAKSHGFSSFADFKAIQDWGGYSEIVEAPGENGTVPVQDGVGGQDEMQVDHDEPVALGSGENQVRGNGGGRPVADASADKSTGGISIRGAAEKANAVKKANVGPVQTKAASGTSVE